MPAPAGGGVDMATILVVDDHLDNRQFLVKVLGCFGHQLLEAGDGVAALEQMRKESVDLIITDLFMPRMGGFEFISRVRADAVIAHIPAVFYTATSLRSQVTPLAEKL